MDTSPLTNFLDLNYLELEQLNTEALQLSESGKSESVIKRKYSKYLLEETRIKAVTIFFCDIEGRLHMLDYDKKYFLNSHENLTFDGSSIRGFAGIERSDLRLVPDWSSFRWLPSDIFGPGKVMMFGTSANADGSPYETDFRSRLMDLLSQLRSKKGYTVNVAPEIEGFVVEGDNAEQNFDEDMGFKPLSRGGYYHALPQDKLRVFIDRAAEAQRAMGFQNEKDHPEVAPSQFELNYRYTEALNAADQVLIYKLICRQIADSMGVTATFLPKPIVGINGSGMHCNISISKDGKNIFSDSKSKDRLSTVAWGFVDRILGHAPEICLVLNSSVNSYRRLDPNFEAPNQIKVSDSDRSSMIRIPIGNGSSTRIEVRSIAPDANPYLLLYTLIRTGLEGSPLKVDKSKRPRVRYLPGNINSAISAFKESDFVTEILGEESKKRYVDIKQTVADRCPAELGTRVKQGEVRFHHEVTNQVLWNSF